MGSSRILCYHGVCAKDPLRYNSLFVSAGTFEEHLKYFKSNFNLVSLDEYCLDNNDTGKLNLCLSFDDGFENNSRNVLPLLEKYRIPGIFFITAIRKAGYPVLWNDVLSLSKKWGPVNLVFGGRHYIKDENEEYREEVSGILLKELLAKTGFEAKAEIISVLFSYIADKDKEYWMQMSEQQIAQLSESPFATIGSHGYYHNDLVNLDPGDAAWELKRSREYLEEITGQNITAFAFPYGSYTPRLLELAHEAGYTLLLGADPSKEDQITLGLRQRMIINPFISVKRQMKAIVKGRYE